MVNHLYTQTLMEGAENTYQYGGLLELGHYCERSYHFHNTVYTCKVDAGEAEFGAVTRVRVQLFSSKEKGHVLAEQTLARRVIR